MRILRQPEGWKLPRLRVRLRGHGAAGADAVLTLRQGETASLVLPGREGGAEVMRLKLVDGELVVYQLQAWSTTSLESIDNLRRWQKLADEEAPVWT